MGPNQWADAAAADGSMQPALQQQQQQQQTELQQQQVQAQQPPAHEDQLDRQMLRHLLKKWGPDGLARLMQEEETTTSLSRMCWPVFIHPISFRMAFHFAAWFLDLFWWNSTPVLPSPIIQSSFTNHDECRDL